jgi:hypothetical protein
MHWSHISLCFLVWPRMSSIIVSLESNVVTQPLTRNTPLGSKRLHSFPHQLMPYWWSFNLVHIFKIRWAYHIVFISTKNLTAFVVLTPQKCKEPFSRNWVILVVSRCVKISDFTQTNHPFCSKNIDSFIFNMLQSSSHLAN